MMSADSFTAASGSLWSSWGAEPTKTKPETLASEALCCCNLKCSKVPKDKYIIQRRKYNYK